MPRPTNDSEFGTTLDELIDPTPTPKLKLPISRSHKLSQGSQWAKARIEWLAKQPRTRLEKRLSALAEVLYHLRMQRREHTRVLREAALGIEHPAKAVVHALREEQRLSAQVWRLQKRQTMLKGEALAVGDRPDWSLRVRGRRLPRPVA